MGDDHVGDDEHDVRAPDVPRAPIHSPATSAATEIGGDPACWLNRVCDTCGRFVEDQFASSCPYCGARPDAQGGS